nr:unnamed protein product [Digitaria exilis]
MGNNLQWCPEFNNLKFLTLGKWCLDASFCGLIAFLQNSPNLEQLTLDLEGHVAKREPLVGEQGFLCEHLMTVEIICPEHGPLMNKLEEFFVGNGINPGQIHIKH